MADVVIAINAEDNTSGILGGIGTGFANLGSIVSGIRDAFDLLSGAVNAGIGFISGFVSEASEAELASADLKAVLESTGGAAGMTFDELNNLASGLQGVTRFSDETIMRGEGMLLTFTNLGKEVFPLATEAMLDMSAKMGTDVQSAAIQLGKALNDPIAGISALTRVGVTFNDEQKEMIKQLVESGDIMGAQKIILAELNKEFGGAAKAAGETFAGQIDIAKNKVSDMKEMIGNALLPILRDLLDKFNEFLDSPAVQGFLKQVVENIQGFARALQSEDPGAALSEWAADLFQGLTDSVDKWVAGGGPEKLTEAVTGWLDDLATGEGTENKALAAMQGLVIAIADAIGKVDWEKIAASMDAALGRAIEGHDWVSSGDNFGKMIEGLFTADLTASFGESSTIAALGKALGDWFRGAVGDVYFEHSIQDIISAMLRILLESLRDGLVDAAIDAHEAWINFWINLFRSDDLPAYVYSFDIGKDLVRGLVNGLNSIEVNITNWVRDHIVDPFKRFLGIASPSTLFYSFGKDIVQGLINGVNNLADDLWSAFKSIINGILSLPGFKQIAEFLGITTSSGQTGDIGGGTVGGGAGQGPDTRGGIPGTPTTTTGGNNLYFYGPVYVGSIDELMYDCAQTNPLLQAGASTVAVGL